MIPKRIHFAWFGSPIPTRIQNRIDEWRRMLPDWHFYLWNEENYDLNRFSFSAQMYQQGRYGYVADELRYDVLNRCGGVYLDTDMVLKRNLAPLLNHNMVWGFLYDNSLADGFIASRPNMPILQTILDVYAGERYPDIHADLNAMTSNPIVTKIFMQVFPEFRTNGQTQTLKNDIQIFSKDYFSYPSRRSEANYAEHLFDNSWGAANRGAYGRLKQAMAAYTPYLWAAISARRGIKSAERDGVPLQK